MRISILLSVALVAFAACSKSSESTSGGTGGAGGQSAAQFRSEAAALARDDIPCQTDADCCVVFDNCWDDGYVVGASDKDHAADLLAQAAAAEEAEQGCLACIPPAIQVRCSANKVCIAEAFSSCDWEAGMQDHCGELTVPNGCGGGGSGGVGGSAGGGGAGGAVSGSGQFLIMGCG